MRSKVVDVLMKRDNMTEQEAKKLVSRVSEEITNAIENDEYDLVEEIMYSDLGLEMDYIDDVLYL